MLCFPCCYGAFHLHLLNYQSTNWTGMWNWMKLSVKLAVENLWISKWHYCYVHGENTVNCSSSFLCPGHHCRRPVGKDGRFSVFQPPTPFKIALWDHRFGTFKHPIRWEGRWFWGRARLQQAIFWKRVQSGIGYKRVLLRLSYWQDLHDSYILDVTQNATFD